MASKEGDDRVAAIASLISQGTGDVRAMAMNHFRALPFSSLTEEHMLSNNDTGLFQLTVAGIGKVVAAFVSHSWSDPGEAKWHCMCEWVAMRSVEDPLLWLDKACISQTDIQGSLAGLPIFLEACQELLVLVGKSYTTRLWCVMELYTFVRMKGGIDRLTVMLLDEEESLMERLSSFDAGQARCFLAKDREHLMAVIEASYGTMRPFNKQMQQLLFVASREFSTMRTQSSKSSRAFAQAVDDQCVAPPDAGVCGAAHMAEHADHQSAVQPTTAASSGQFDDIQLVFSRTLSDASLARLDLPI